MLVLLAVLTWQAAPAGADVSQSDGVVTATLIGATRLDDQDWSAAPTAVFRIQVLAPNTSVQCRSGDGGNDVPCGTEQSSGCPAYQCWTYSMPIGNSQYNDLYVDYTGADDTPTYLQFSFNTYATPPQTTVATPPTPSLSGSGARAFERFFDVSYNDVDPLPVHFQCALSAPSASSVRWSACRWARNGDDPDPAVVLPRLRLTGVYRFSARAVDVFGRADPTPAQYVFSPTPCRASVRGRIPSYSQIVGHGLPIVVKCIESGRFEIDLDVPSSWAFDCGGSTTTGLGYLFARTTRLDQTVQLRLRMLRCAPRPASGTTRIPLQLLAIPLEFGASQERKFSARA